MSSRACSTAAAPRSRVGLLVVGFAFVLGVPLGLASGYFGGTHRQSSDAARRRLPHLPAAAARRGAGRPAGAGNPERHAGAGSRAGARCWRAWCAAARCRCARRSTSSPQGRSAPAPARIVLSHLLRNVMSPIVVQLTIVFAAAVVAEASLSFLGLRHAAAAAELGPRHERGAALPGRRAVDVPGADR